MVLYDIFSGAVKTGCWDWCWPEWFCNWFKYFLRWNLWVSLCGSGEDFGGFFLNIVPHFLYPLLNFLGYPSSAGEGWVCVWHAWHFQCSVQPYVVLCFFGFSLVCVWVCVCAPLLWKDSYRGTENKMSKERDTFKVQQMTRAVIGLGSSA